MTHDPMKMNRSFAVRLGLGILGITALAEVGWAQTFTYTNNDLLLGFRKTGTFQETHEVVVNIGKATNYVQAGPGANIAVPNFTLSQLSPGSFANLNHLNWSVVGFSKTNLGTVLPGYMNNVLWVTVPRTSPGLQSTPPARLSYSDQGGKVAVNINAIGVNAVFLSSQTASNQFNTPKLIQEPVNDSSDLTSYIGGLSSSSDSTLRDTWSPNLENSTPASFTTCLVSDLYEVWPINESHGFPVTDPHTGLTSGPAYYVGYFQFCPDGTMTFVRASGTAPPPAPQLTVTRGGTTNYISFPSANGAVYTLYYTNAAGLTRPVSTWPTSPTTITGDGSVKTFTNSPGDAERFYRVGAQ
jgi:hypothetical protein